MSKELVFFSWGGVGDALCRTPTYKALRKKYPDKKIFVYYSMSTHREMFLNNPHVDVVKLLGLKSVIFKPTHLLTLLNLQFRNNIFLKFFKRWVVKYTVMHFQHVPLTWIYERHVIDIVPEIFKLELEDRRIQLFITSMEEENARKKLKEFHNVIFLHISSRSSKNHHWQLNKWSELIKSLPNYTFIQFGLRDEAYVDGAIDFRGKTNLREAWAILKCSLSFVGVDSGFGHATNAFDIPGVVLWGDSSPIHWAHDNNINIYKNVECSPCYYELQGGNCPYGNKCMTLITVEEVRDALVKQVNKRLNNDV
jgi:ADP-heptose:LPS heptosyltransferase